MRIHHTAVIVMHKYPDGTWRDPGPPKPPSAYYASGLSGWADDITFKMTYRAGAQADADARILRTVFGTDHA